MSAIRHLLQGTADIERQDHAKSMNGHGRGDQRDPPAHFGKRGDVFGNGGITHLTRVSTSLIYRRCVKVAMGGRTVTYCEQMWSTNEHEHGCMGVSLSLSQSIGTLVHFNVIVDCSG